MNQTIERQIDKSVKAYTASCKRKGKYMALVTQEMQRQPHYRDDALVRDLLDAPALARLAEQAGLTMTDLRTTSAVSYEEWCAAVDAIEHPH